MWTLFAPLILQARRGDEGYCWLDLRHPGSAEIGCYHCDIDCCCLWTWDIGKFQVIQRTHEYWEQNFPVLPCSLWQHTVSCFKNLYHTKGSLMCHPGRFKEGWQFSVFSCVCIFILALSFCSRTPGILVYT